MSTELNFDFSSINPLFEGGSFLPVSDDKGWLVILTKDNGFKPTKSGNGHYLELVGVGQEGPVSGVEFSLRFNTNNPEPKAVAAAYQELSALGHVLGLPGRIGNTAELFNKPFRLVSEQQTDKEGKPTQFTQLARNGIRDANGNKPGQNAGGPQGGAPQTTPQVPPQNQQQQQQPPQGGNMQGGNWGGAPQQQNQNGGGWGGAPQGGGMPGGPGAGGPAWGAPQGQGGNMQQQPPQGQNFGAPQGAPTWANQQGQ